MKNKAFYPFIAVCLPWLGTKWIDLSKILSLGVKEESRQAFDRMLDSFPSPINEVKMLPTSTKLDSRFLSHLLGRKNEVTFPSC